MTDRDDLPLRQRKFARTRLALLAALRARLETQTYDVVRVRDLCADAEISEASFFNYFARKEDLLVYFIQIWSLAVGWHARQTLAARGALAAITDIFERTAAEIAAHPRVMAEVIAFQARLERTPELPKVTLAERRLAFPDLPGVEALPTQGLEDLLPVLLQAAQASGELPRQVDTRLLFLTLAALFFGTPVALRRVGPAGVGAAWRAQLALLWQAVRATPLTPAAKPPKRSKT